LQKRQSYKSNFCISFSYTPHTLSIHHLYTIHTPSIESVLAYDLGNKLLNVTDTTNYSTGFDDGNNHQTTFVNDFEYDTYGNLIIDRNKGITEISYNHLNLPKKITFGTQGTMTYLYDATGQKLKKTMTEGTNIQNTEYLDGFQYTQDVLDFFPHQEGYVKVVSAQGVGGGSSFNYVFSYTDHLGNIRLRYTKTETQGLTILEENHYYPFGLKHNGYNSDHKIFEFNDGINSVVLTPVTPSRKETYKYKYNGKELQDELGLNMYDYGARNYMPDLGRWANIDNKSETYFSMSPFNYAGNNPIVFVDYDGNDGVITVTQVWYNDGKSKTIDLLNKAINYLNGISGKYGVETKDGKIMPINFAIQFSSEKGETVDDGYTIHDSNIDKAESSNISNYISAGGMEVRNLNQSQSVVGAALNGGDNTKYCADCNMYGDTLDYNADEKVVGHEIMHTLGISHTAIGKQGTSMTTDGIGGMLQYAAKNSKGLKVNLSNVKAGSYLGSREEPISRTDKPKVVNTSPQKIKLNGTIVEIK